MLFLLLVTLISLLLAVIMSVIAWRVAREERRRSEARVAALAADIHDSAPTERDWELRRPADTPVSIPAAGLFQTSQAERTRPRFAAVVGIGVLVLGSVVAAVLMLGNGSSAATAHVASGGTSANGANPTNVATMRDSANAITPVPLELLALGHERDGDRLTVRGVVRNPASGREVDRVTAVIFLYNRDGGFLSSGRAPIHSSALVAGGESDFTVTVPGAGDVGRYRVSFRTEDFVVPHVDYRDRRDHGQ
jgi:hypothetical protein